MAEGLNKIRRASVVAFLCLASGAVVAGTSLESLRGIALGSSVKGMPSCDKPQASDVFARRAEPSAPAAPCTRVEDDVRGHTFDFGYTVIENLDHIPAIGRTAAVRVLDDKVQEVQVLFLPSSYQLIFEGLVSKYGAPNDGGLRTLQNAYGAQVGVRFASWRGEWGQLTIDERRPGRSEFGHIRLTATTAVEEAATQRNRVSRALRQGL